MTVDIYISTFPKEVQLLLEELRATIKSAAPNATEIIAYQMPAYRLNGVLCYFAAWKKHIGFYPSGRGIEAFKEQLAAHKYAKGSIQFPFDKPLPLDLIAEIVRFRVGENEAKKVR
jgi:uncharacterized protein YdhG (YjbR/CyaY superfamily)